MVGFLHRLADAFLFLPSLAFEAIFAARSVATESGRSYNFADP